jgi:hypothetical protein
MQDCQSEQVVTISAAEEEIKVRLPVASNGKIPLQPAPHHSTLNLMDHPAKFPNLKVLLMAMPSCARNTPSSG